MPVESKEVWATNGTSIIKFNNAQVVLRPNRYLRFNSHPLQYVLITELLRPNDSGDESDVFKVSKAIDIVWLLQKRAI